MRHSRRWAPALAWGGFLLFLGSRPGGDLPSGGVLDLPGADKIAHAIAYGVLGALVQRGAVRTSTLQAVATGAVAALGFGGLDEILQSRVPGRTADPWDLAADLVGAALGAWLWIRTFPPPARSRV